MNIDHATLETYTGIENTQARVMHSQFSDGEPAFGVILTDLDSGEAIGGIRIYRKLAFAVDYAKSLVSAK